MQFGPGGQFHLTYCTNIHPGETWKEVSANLRKFGPALKKRLSPNEPFGLGLRLSKVGAEELLSGDNLSRFREILASHGLYVAIINGFPYGSFHNRVIKSDVMAPDWRTDERVRYTLQLVEVIKGLVPTGLDAGISTSPLSYKGWIQSNETAAWEEITGNIVRVAAAMARVHAECGVLVHLDLEPEPDGLIENSAETADFFERWLLPVGVPLLAHELQIYEETARRVMLDHVQVCYDTCHFAVEYEDTETALARFQRLGIKIGRIQVSSALRVGLLPDGRLRARLAGQLAAFAESTYLHQVLERRDDGEIFHYPDLADALPHIKNPAAREWRIHFHVPLFVKEYGDFGSTQDEILPVFKALRRDAFTRHLEIETYTWGVLPTALRMDMLEMIEREYRWVMAAF